MDGDLLIENLSAEIPLDSHVAIVGDAVSGKGHLALLLARLLDTSGGTLRFGSNDAAQLDEAATGRTIGYVGATSHLFSAPLVYNLLYGIRQKPQVTMWKTQRKMVSSLIIVMIAGLSSAHLASES